MTQRQPTSELGLIGLAVMGQNLALNLARNGFPISVFNRSSSRTKAFMQRVDGEPITAADSIDELIRTLKRPRKVLLMVQAGTAVDATIDKMLPFLEAGDLIIDGGNSHPDDTARRSTDLEAKGFRFVGMGVSGGEEGALNGPSMMPGGSKDAYEELRPMLEKVAAQTDDGPCVTHCGTGAAGHFVKMVHNGIEYGDMQLIAETFDLMRHARGMQPQELASVFKEWNSGVLESYLIEITADILTRMDPETDRPMVDVILDKAGQKGTGRWTAEIGLAEGVPLPTIHAAVDARVLSSKKGERSIAAGKLSGPASTTSSDEQLLSKAEHALYCSKICSYAQGFDLLRAADRKHSWGVDMAEVARIWKGGCIIRAGFLDRIKEAYRRNPELANLLLDEQLGGYLVEHQQAWRDTLGASAQAGVPTLAMGGSLAYFDSYRREQLPQNLTQAQRDYFGAHTYERVDKAEGEFFHTEWL